jgi:hypothetical protein
MKRRLWVVLGVAAATFVLAVRAEQRLPVKIDSKGKSDIKRSADKTDPKIKIQDAATQQERLKRLYDEFKQKLLSLAQRMENSTKPEDREKAKVLRDALKKASEEGVETRFSSIIERLRQPDAYQDLELLKDILEENEALRRALRELMALLLKDDRSAQLKAEIERNKKLLEELKAVIRQQEITRDNTIIGRKKNEDLAKTQERVRNKTDALVNPKSNKGNEAKNGEGKGSKSGKKGIGEGKDDTKDPKADSKDSKGGEGKDGKGGEGKDAKGGEGKDGKSGEGKDGKGGEGKDGKPGEGKDGKGGEGKDGKAGEGKDGKGGEGKDGKPGEGKDGKPGAGKPSDKPGNAKPGDAKPGSKPGAGKPGDAKPGSGKPGAGKPGESKNAKPGAGKSGDSKGKGEGKGDPKGGSGKSGSGKSGEGKPGKGGQSGQSGQSGQQGESKPGQSGKGGKQQQQPTPEQTQIKKQIQDVEKYQKNAEDKIRKDQRKPASEDQDTALENLRRIQKQLEDLLRQLREEEIERLLAQLEARCRHMLVLQIAVRDGTVDLDKVIKSNPNAQPSRADQQQSNVLSDKEEEIVKEARAGLRLLEEEGSAVAFAEVFTQVKGDMETVAERLRKTDTGEVTVTIENQIIETLQEMIEALKKAQADNKPKSKSGQSQSGQPPDPKLIDLLAELKMIRSLQKRVNSRTELYGKQYSGEQAPPPEKASSETEREKYERIQKELKDLSKRQQKISKVTHDIATGKNESK